MTGTPQYNWPHACAGRWRGSCRRRVTLEDDDGDENRWSIPRSSVISVLLNYESKFQQQNERPPAAAAARSAPVYGATRSALSGLSRVSVPHLLLSQFYKRLVTNVQSRARQQILITMIASNFRSALCLWYDGFLGFELWALIDTEGQFATRPVIHSGIFLITVMSGYLSCGGSLFVVCVFHQTPFQFCCGYQL